MKRKKNRSGGGWGYISALAAEAAALGREAMTVFICGMGCATPCRYGVAVLTCAGGEGGSHRCRLPLCADA